MPDEIQLTVKRLKDKDAGLGIVRISQGAVSKLGLDYEEYVRVENDSGQSSVARVERPYFEDRGETIIRVDGQLRVEADVAIDDNVRVHGIDPTDATEVVVAAPPEYEIENDLDDMVRSKLGDRPVSVNQELDVHMTASPLSRAGGERLPIRIVDMAPDDVGVVTDTTTITLKSTSRASLTGGPSVTLDEQSDADASVDGNVPTQTISYDDVGGLDDAIEQIRELVELPMLNPELFAEAGVEPPKGVLLSGPPGTGKTLLARAVASESHAYFDHLSGPEFMSEYYGESEGELREIFEEAKENEPAVIFFDEIDAVAPSRGETSGDLERRVVAQLLSLMDGLDERGQVVVIGATNRPDAIDPALRRGGRFDREIEIAVPDRDERREVLDIHTHGMPVADDVEVEAFADKTHGYVGADLESLSREAALAAIRRVRRGFEDDDHWVDLEMSGDLEITSEDFERGYDHTEPSVLRDFGVEVPDVSWDDVGGLEEVKATLRKTVQWPFESPETFESMDLETSQGVLLYGPPGTGKTLLAKAIANEIQSNFISVKGPELLDQFVGGSEESVREVFDRARETAPTVVFFDEIDAIAPQRGTSSSDTGVSDRVVSQLLTELDGLEKREDVVMIAATNRPDVIDQALMRPGRLDRHIHVPVPEEAERRAILEVHTRGKPLADDVDLDALAVKTHGYVGTDIRALCRVASMAALEEYAEETEVGSLDVDEVAIADRHFEAALEEVSRSVTEEIREEYEEIERRYDSGEPAMRNRSSGRGFQ